MEAGGGDGCATPFRKNFLQVRGVPKACNARVLASSIFPNTTDPRVERVSSTRVSRWDNRSRSRDRAGDFTTHSFAPRTIVTSHSTHHKYFSATCITVAAEFAVSVRIPPSPSVCPFSKRLGADFFVFRRKPSQRTRCWACDGYKDKYAVAFFEISLAGCRFFTTAVRTAKDSSRP